MRPQNVLLLYKVSTYHYYQQISSSPKPASAEIERFRQTHEVHYQTLQYVEDILNENKLSYQKVARGQLKDYSGFDLIITVGGDGTFLEGARYAADQLIFGVNSDPDWSVGRLCSAAPNTFKDFVNDILSDEFIKFEINRLEVSFNDDRDPVYCINDVLVAHATPASLSRYRICVDDICEEQRSSGVWISTAAGSTGAIHSAGGEVLDLMSHEFQYLPRELYRGWGDGDYQLTGKVLPNTCSIAITSLMAEGMLFIDGSHQRIDFSASQRINISQAPQPLLVVHRK